MHEHRRYRGKNAGACWHVPSLCQRPETDRYTQELGGTQMHPCVQAQPGHTVYDHVRSPVSCAGPGRAHPPAEVVEHHDVGVHVVQVVAVRRVLLAGPDVRAGALV